MIREMGHFSKHKLKRIRWAAPAAASAGLILLTTLSGCNDGLQSLDDADLAERWEECRNVNAPTPALVQSCQNVERECQRRARELKNHVC